MSLEPGVSRGRSKMKMRAVILGISMIAAVFVIGLYVASPQPTEGAIDCKTVTPGPKFCNITNPDIPARQPGDPVTFLISGCGYHNGDRSMPCYHSVAGIVAVLIAAANFILGIVGALALFMFVWGGLQWVMSAGEEERVKAGVTTLRNAVIGLLIVFSSWLGVNYIVNTLTDSKGLFKSGANTWFTVNYDTLCYRPLTAEELDCQLTKPYQPVAPAPTPVGSSSCPSGATRPYPNDCPCRDDADCASNTCKQVSIRERRCVGSGPTATPAPATEKGVCCFVRIDGTKGAARDYTQSGCKNYLRQNICVDRSFTEARENFWCRYVGDPSISGTTAIQTCWKKSAKKISEDKEKGRCGDPVTIAPQCSMPGEPL